MKRRLRGRKKDALQEVFALCLNQRRHDADGKRITGYTADQIMEMGPGERAAVKRSGWLGKTETRRQ
jgi:hypothetical protein